jgi:hypothetical protein
MLKYYPAPDDQRERDRGRGRPARRVRWFTLVVGSVLLAGFGAPGVAAIAGFSRRGLVLTFLAGAMVCVVVGALLQIGRWGDRAGRGMVRCKLCGLEVGTGEADGPIGATFRRCPECGQRQG